MSILDECNVPHESHLHGLPELGDTTAHTWEWDPRFMCFCTLPASFTPFYEKKRGLFAHGCASYHTFVFTVWCVVSVKSMQRKKLDLTRTELELNRYLYSDDGARNRCYGSDRRAACRSPPRASGCCRCCSPTCARCCSPPRACECWCCCCRHRRSP